MDFSNKVIGYVPIGHSHSEKLTDGKIIIRAAKQEISFRKFSNRHSVFSKFCRMAATDSLVRMILFQQPVYRFVPSYSYPLLVEYPVFLNKDDQFFEILEEAREELNVSSEDFLTILSRIFQARDLTLNRYWGDRGDSEGKIINELENEAREAMERSLQKLRNRIDRFGVSEPNISPLGSRRILIALPGVSDPDRAKDLI